MMFPELMKKKSVATIIGEVAGSMLADVGKGFLWGVGFWAAYGWMVHQ